MEEQPDAAQNNPGALQETHDQQEEGKVHSDESKAEEEVEIAQQEQSNDQQNGEETSQNAESKHKEGEAANDQEEAGVAPNEHVEDEEEEEPQQQQQDEEEQQQQEQEDEEEQQQQEQEDEEEQQQQQEEAVDEPGGVEEDEEDAEHEGKEIEAKVDPPKRKSKSRIPVPVPVMTNENFHDDDEQEDEIVLSPGGSRKPRKRSGTCAEIGTKSFSESILRTGLWVPKGVGRVPGSNNRVLIIVGEKDKSRDWLSVASGILQAAAHTDAIVIDQPGPKSIFNGIRVNGSAALPDIVGVGPKTKTVVCPQHRVSIIAEDSMDDCDEEFLMAKMNLARNLAGPYKIAVLNLAKSLDQHGHETLKFANKMNWPVLSLFDSERPIGVQFSKYASFPKPAKGNESEFASFIHLHLTVDLFSM